METVASGVLVSQPDEVAVVAECFEDVVEFAGEQRAVGCIGHETGVESFKFRLAEAARRAAELAKDFTGEAAFTAAGHSRMCRRSVGQRGCCRTRARKGEASYQATQLNPCTTARVAQCPARPASPNHAYAPPPSPVHPLRPALTFRKPLHSFHGRIRVVAHASSCRNTERAAERRVGTS